MRTSPTYNTVGDLASVVQQTEVPPLQGLACGDVSQPVPERIQQNQTL